MKEKYQLDEAIKEFYEIKPLRRDLAATVAHKIFAEEQKKESLVGDKILLAALCFLMVVSLIYAFSLLAEVSLTAILLCVITLGAFIGLTIKEHFILLRRIHQVV